MLEFSEFTTVEKEDLIAFLTTGTWPFHSSPKITREKVENSLQNGYFNGLGIKTFWIIEDQKKIGLIRLFDLGDGVDDDETPLFDIKIKQEFCAKGFGKQAVKWLTDFVFTNYSNKNRFEATTRIDNVAMRKVLERCSFVKEAHYRQAWPDDNGNFYDCIGYSILRSDWSNKTTTSVRWKE